MMELMLNVSTHDYPLGLIHKNFGQLFVAFLNTFIYK